MNDNGVTRIARALLPSALGIVAGIGAALVTGGVTAWAVHRWQRRGERARQALRDGVQRFREADFSVASPSPATTSWAS